MDGRDAQASGAGPPLPARQEVWREVCQGGRERQEGCHQEPVREVARYGSEEGFVKQESLGKRLMSIVGFGR